MFLNCMYFITVGLCSNVIYDATCEWKYVGKYLKCLPRDYDYNQIHIQSGFDVNKLNYEMMPIDASYVAQDDETKAYLYLPGWKNYQKRYNEQKKEIDILNRMDWYHLQHVVVETYEDMLKDRNYASNEGWK